MKNKQAGFIGVAIVVVVVLILATSGYFAWKHHNDSNTGGQKNELPGFIKTIIAREPNTEVKQCTVSGKTYYVTDNTQIADEGNPVYDETGTQIDSCFGFVAPDSISPFCKSFDTSGCVIVSTPEMPQTVEGGNTAILGNQQDLVSFSLTPGSSVSGKMTVTGSVKGGYFFEGNILINIRAVDNTLLRAGHGQATTDWMTAEPVSFSADVDFTGLPKGEAYLVIHNDNPSDMRENDKEIAIPIVIN